MPRRLLRPRRRASGAEPAVQAIPYFEKALSIGVRRRRTVSPLEADHAQYIQSGAAARRKGQARRVTARRPPPAAFVRANRMPGRRAVFAPQSGTKKINPAEAGFIVTGRRPEVQAIRRRRRSHPKPARAAPRIERVAGSGTAVDVVPTSSNQSKAIKSPDPLRSRCRSTSPAKLAAANSAALSVNEWIAVTKRPSAKENGTLTSLMLAASAPNTSDWKSPPAKLSVAEVRVPVKGSNTSSVVDVFGPLPGKIEEYTSVIWGRSSRRFQQHLGCSGDGNPKQGTQGLPGHCKIHRQLADKWVPTFAGTAFSSRFDRHRVGRTSSPRTGGSGMHIRYALHKNMIR